jgi:eukaryotic-like serine/threonine-protein kinase
VLQEHEAELRVARAEGIVATDEAEALRTEAAAEQRRPLDLLRERGKISDETLISLRRMVGGDPDATGSLAPPSTARGKDFSDAALGATLQMPPPGGATGSATDPDPGADPDATATLDPARAAALPRGVPDFPIPGWNRYKPIRFLGQGGMGKVFLARDLRLRREVAIKFVRSDDPVHVARLITEARAQARVDHERVCKVYEVGEAQGEVYIAMQYIAGETLGALAKELTVEQKAMILRDASLGIHEAHRAGIIHRDLKPGNIMVERAEDGRLKAFVMDFGLARDWTEGATETGTVLGTPHYMAPEQARGEVQRLDRRADVYSLGATLYYLLTGKASVPGENALEVLSNIATAEPLALRAIDPDIPADLEAIALKCLEKDRSARYDSARALAEDLDRFLRGEPVEARPIGTWYRLRKRLAKHRGLMIAAAVAASLLLAALGWGISTRREAAARERLAQRFTELVERIESLARYSALSPLHDIRGDQAAIRARMDELSREITNAGPLAVGPGHYALGRGYLALGDEQKARELLESAWERGYHEPRAAYALALVVGRQYAERLREIERIESKDRRESQRRDLEHRYRDPALAYLRQSQGAEVPSAEYVAALVAFYEGRLDDALARLDAIGVGLPWFYEAPALRGDVLEARASRRWNEGDREGALADFEAGRRAYAVAESIGESAPAVHEALGELEYAAMRMELYGQGDVKPPFERGEEAARRALVALPEHYRARVLQASLYRRFAEHEADRGGNVDDLMAKAIAAAEAAVALAPTQAPGRMELGRSYYQSGSYRQEHNLDPRAELRKAIEIFGGVSAGDRDYDYHLYVGLIYQTWADYEDQIGLDSLPNRGKTIEAYLAATRLDERKPPAWINLGTTYFMRAVQPRSPDPDGDLERARAALEKAHTLNPKHVVPCFYGGEVHSAMGLRERARGRDGRPELTKALDSYREGLAINPSMWHLHSGAGISLLELGREAWDRGQSPDLLLQQAIAELEQAVTAAPEQASAHDNLGEALLQRARFERARGDDPVVSALAALAALQRAVALSPEVPALWANLGMIHLFLAEQDLAQKREPRARLDQALEALDRGSKPSPNEANAHLGLGEARGLLARVHAQNGPASSADLEAGAQEMEKAIALAPDELEYRLRFGQFCVARAAAEKKATRAAAPILQRGLALAAQVLAARPEWPDARLLRARLLLIQAQAAESPAEQREIAARAGDDFTAALAANPNLEHAWSEEAQSARRLRRLPP